MGLNRSKFPISYEEACTRAGPEVVSRLKETYNKYASNTGLLPQVTFLRDIFGDGMPPKLAELLYDAFHGGQKGIKFNDLLRGLVLLVHGNHAEKAEFLAQMLSTEGTVMKETVLNLVAKVDIDPSPENLDTLFSRESWCSTEQFAVWVRKHPNLCSFTQWLFDDESTMSFMAEPDPPTFYQTLAKTHDVSETDVMNVEKTYWSLKGSNGKFDSEVLKKVISPPIPESLSNRLFDFLDINIDGHIDLSEIVRGVALLCRRPLKKRIEVCFKLFDQDKDGFLIREELTSAIELLVSMKNENSIEGEAAVTASNVLGTLQDKLEGNGLSKEEFVQWSQEEASIGRGLVGVLLQVLVEVCHVKLGLRPSDAIEERNIIKGYMNRFGRNGRKKGQSVYLMSADWFNTWRLYTSYEMEQCPLSSIVKVSQNVTTDVPRKQSSIHVPVADPITEAVDVVDEGEDAIEAYTHIVAEPTNTTSNSWNLSLCSANSNVTTPTQTGPAAAANGNDSQKPPQIDNSVLCQSEPFAGSKKLISLTNEGGHLLINLKEFQNYYVLPEDVWRALVVWYGTVSFSGGPALPRMVTDDDGSLALYPIMLKVFRHTTLPPGKQQKSGPWNSVLEVLNFIGIRSMGEASATPVSGPALPGDSTQPVLPRRVLYYSAAFDKSTTVLQICDTLQKVLHAKPEDLRIYNLVDEERPELLDEEEQTLESLGYRHGHKILVETRNKDNSWPEELVAVIKEVQANESEKEKTTPQRNKVPEGATGLSNLGNTCFMNSALQCISNLQPLTIYFREKDYLSEINKQNPLGMKGVLAKRYGELVNDLWSGHNKSITPWRFRYTIAQNAPQFNNFQQQDAQELLSFVLDGLHEDLNRVKVKPYRELPDSDGRPVAEVADEAWSYHRERNDSIIVDLFQGQLKSLVECTECSYTSMKFDPFTFLSLPLPLESTTNLEVIVVSLNGRQPVRYCLKLELDAKYRLLRDKLTELSEVSNLFLVDVFGGIVRSFPLDTQKIRTILSGSLYAYETPPPPPTSQLTERADSPVDIMRDESDSKLSQEEQQLASGTVAVDNGEESKEVDESNGASPDSEGAESEAVEVESESKEVEPEVKEVESESKEVEPEVKEVESESKEVEPEVKEVESESKEVEPEVKEVESESKEVEPEVKESKGVESESKGVESSSDENGVKQKSSESKTSRSPSPPQQLPSYCTPGIHGFLFGMHRRTLRVENYFISTQKNRPVLFSTPMVIPCLPTTAHSELYEIIWNQVKRLIIRDPPNNTSQETAAVNKDYPYKLKMVKRDGLFCCKCPWYRFCRGCPIPCDEGTIGNDPPHYIAIEWDDGFLHLKYQAALEKPKDDESMDAMKNSDSEPINLTDCLAAFSKPEELGEDELWYCKRCETHRPARKTLEVWKLPPVLIVHVKRFHFHNGRWIKSQRRVNFPMKDLDLFAYSEPKSVDSSGESAVSDEVQNLDNRGGMVSVTPPLLGEGEESAPLVVSAEVHEENSQVLSENEGQDVGGSTANNEQETGSSSHEEQNEGGSFKNRPHPIHLDRTYSRTTSTYMSSRPIYDLFSITCHSGVLGGGHYTSFAKNPNSKWYYYNDSTCKETTEERVESESPYLLFYEVRDIHENMSAYRAANGKNAVPSSPFDEDDDGTKQRESGKGKGGASGRGRCRQQ